MIQKKSGLFAAICMCVGTIIGAGIFGALPAAVSLVGTGIFWAFLVAGISTIIRNMPSLAPGCAIPAPAGFYMHLTRLVNPYVGFLDFILIIMELFINALLATVFGAYLAELAPVSPTVAAVIVLVFFGITSCLGFRIGATVQTIMTIILIATILCFGALGTINMKPEYLALQTAFFPNELNIVTFGAAVGMLTGSLQGGVCIMQFADAYKNPHKTIMWSFIISTTIAMLMYMLMSAAVVGTTSIGDIKELNSLVPIAKTFMPNYLVIVLIVGGALLATATSINGVLLSSVYRLNTIGKDQVLPKWLIKPNKFGAQPMAIWLVIIAAISIVVFELPFGILLSVASVITTVVTIVELIPVIMLKKRFPYCYKNAAIRFPDPALWTMILIASGLGLWQVYSMVVTINSTIWVATSITIIVCYGYFLARKEYLKRQGVDMIALMRVPYPEWVENEKKYADAEANANNSETDAAHSDTV